MPLPKQVRRRVAPVAFTALLLASLAAAPASAEGRDGDSRGDRGSGVQTTELINFSTGDPATDPGTEGIAVGRDGTIYVSANTADGGQIWKVEPGSKTPEVLATVIPPTGGAGFGVLGLELRGKRLLVAAHTLADPELNGVWKVDVRTGEATHIDGTEAIALPNDLTVARGSIYVTDSASGAIWRVGGNDDVELWLQDPLLEGLGSLVPGVPIGANGIDAHRGRLYVANLEKGLVVEVEIGRTHGPGQANVVAEVDGLPDGLEVDRWGRPHVVLIDGNALVRVEGHEVTTIVEDAAVLDAPASLAFGRGRDRGTIYVVNFSIAEGFPDVLEPSDVGPSVVAVTQRRGH